MNRKAAYPIWMLVVIILWASFTGCSDRTVALDAKNPVTITVWHYYNGSILNAFEAMIGEFNETVGMEKGIIVEANGLGSIPELEVAVLSSANKEVGSMEMPNVFASYADTAYAAEKMGLLADLGTYFTESEQAEYITSYIEEGKIGLDGELRIFPIAKSTETLMINETDWQPFADSYGYTYDHLLTAEGLAEAAASYYEWTDAKTPDIPYDGKAFFGRDSMANLFITTSKSFGIEIFEVENGVGKLNVDRDAMKKIWDLYYVPYISGHFTSIGRYRSDDVKVGDLLCYVGSTSSSAYFPSEVTADGATYPVEAKVLPAPRFEGADSVLVQQGAGMVVTKSTPEEEYASVEFLKWFTDLENNILFSAMSGYMPVKQAANDYEFFMSKVEENGRMLDDKTGQTLEVAFGHMEISQMYTNKAFSGGAEARAVLDRSLQEKAAADQEKIMGAVHNGSDRQGLISQYASEKEFDAWLAGFTAELQNAIDSAE